MAHGRRRARALAGFSIMLGGAQLIRPGWVGRLTGLGKSASRQRLVRLVGARELACGVGLLTGVQSATLLWARVAGDAMDLAILSLALRNRSRRRARLALSAAAVVGVGAIDLLAARAAASRSESSDTEQAAIVTRRSISINCSAEAAYRFWRDVENLPRVMPHLLSVQEIGGGRSHWQAKGPGGKNVAWDAEITDDTPNHRIAWRSLPGGDVKNSGSVRFLPAPGGRGIEVHIELHYWPPTGDLGAAVAKLLRRAPGQEVDADLRSLKQLLETGEIARSDDSIRTGPNAARPAPEPIHA